MAFPVGAWFVLAGAGLVLGQVWWAAAGTVAGALAVGLMRLYFQPGWLVGMAISAGAMFAAIQALESA